MKRFIIVLRGPEETAYPKIFKSLKDRADGPWVVVDDEVQFRLGKAVVSGNGAINFVNCCLKAAS
jgi:hypothetical protein